MSCIQQYQSLPSEWVTLSGSVNGVGPIAGLQVTAKSLSCNSFHRILGQSQLSDEQGLWSLTLQPYKGPLLLEASGPALRKPLQSVVPFLAFSEVKPPFSINPISHLAAGHVQYLSKNGCPDPVELKKVQTEMITHFGGLFPFLTTPSQSNPVSSTPAVSFVDDALKMKYLICGLQKLAEDACLINQVAKGSLYTWQEVLSALREDIEEDGLWDGKGTGSQRVRLGNFLFDDETVRQLLAKKVFSCADASREQTNITAKELSSLGNSLASSSASVFATPGKVLEGDIPLILVSNDWVWCTPGKECSIKGSIHGLPARIWAETKSGEYAGEGTQKSAGKNRNIFSVPLDVNILKKETSVVIVGQNNIGQERRVLLDLVWSENKVQLSVLPGGEKASHASTKVSWDRWTENPLILSPFINDLDYESFSFSGSSWNCSTLDIQASHDLRRNQKIAAFVSYRVLINEKELSPSRHLMPSGDNRFSIPLSMKGLLPQGFEEKEIEWIRENNAIARLKDSDLVTIEVSSKSPGGDERIYRFQFFLRLRTEPVHVGSCEIASDLKKMSMFDVPFFHHYSRSIATAKVSWQSRKPRDSWLPDSPLDITFAPRELLSVSGTHLFAEDSAEDYWSVRPYDGIRTIGHFDLSHDQLRSCAESGCAGKVNFQQMCPAYDGWSDEVFCFMKFRDKGKCSAQPISHNPSNNRPWTESTFEPLDAIKIDSNKLSLRDREVQNVSIVTSPEYHGPGIKVQDQIRFSDGRLGYFLWKQWVAEQAYCSDEKLLNMGVFNRYETAAIDEITFQFSGLVVESMSRKGGLPLPSTVEFTGGCEMPLSATIKKW